MIRLNNIQTEQTISFYPRNTLFLDAYTSFLDRVRGDGGIHEESACSHKLTAEMSGIIVYIKKDGSGENESVSPSSIIVEGGYVSMEIPFSILYEDSIYEITMTYDDELWYRDKAYVTDISTTTAYHTLNNFVEYDSGDDEYIINRN